MALAKPNVLITGVSGNLGLRLVQQLEDFSVIGVDITPPAGDCPIQFEKMDLGQEESCRELFQLIRDTKPEAVVHLAFVLDQVRMGILDLDNMWHINVAGTARVMEAVSEANRNHEGGVAKFIFPSSVAAYGPELAGPVLEDYALEAHTLPYAIHKKECDEVVQQRSPSLRNCSAYVLRPHIYTGPTVENYMVGAFRGTPNGKSKRAERMRRQGTRLPCMLPRGQKYVDNKIQFVHVDDVARLIAHIVRREPEAKRLTILNVAGRGEPMTFGQCVDMAKAKLIRVPGKWAMKSVLGVLWRRGISAIPPEALPYMTGQYIMSTERLQKFLGAEYENVIRYTIQDAFRAAVQSPA
jgi:nucleoside-diphosphate-sugar epimerase